MQLEGDCGKKCRHEDCKDKGNSFCWRKKGHDDGHFGTCGHKWD